MWTIYYSDSEVSGESLAEWLEAPDDDVQVIRVEAPGLQPHRSPWAGVQGAHMLTGTDEYSLYGWPAKRGRWMDWDAYVEIWERASGSRNTLR